MLDILFTLVIFVACFALLAVGYIVAGKKIKGSCGGIGIQYKGEDIECGVCGKKGDEIAQCDPKLIKTKSSS